MKSKNLNDIRTTHVQLIKLVFFFFPNIITQMSGFGKCWH